MAIEQRALPTNDLLAALPREKLQKLSDGLKPVLLNFGDRLLEAGKPIRHVYFPTDSLISLLAANPRSVEVGMIGHEGVLGIPLALGVDVSPLRAIVQGTGTALRMDRAHFVNEFRKNPLFQRELLRYSYALMGQITQLSACNLLHPVHQRLARWLLMTHDRVRSDNFQLTHEFLATMLGVRRGGVTVAARSLLRQRLINYSRGRISILDRKGLEAATCRCYGIIANLYDRN